MILFLTISFIAGLLTVLAPCILPLLPVIIGGGVASGSRLRAYRVIGALIISVIAFTLLIKVSSLFLNVSENTWEYVSGVILLLFGVSMIFPDTWESLPFIGSFSVAANRFLGIGLQKENFLGDIIMGAALGPVFSTCSPTYFVILATVLPAHFALGLLYLCAYSLGLGLSLLFVTLFGQRLVDALSIPSDPRGFFKRSIGVVFVFVALLIMTGYDKKIQVWVGNNIFDVTKIEQRLLSSSGKMEAIGTWKEITDPSGYINTDGKPIYLKDYIGKKIILIDFMTYSCINCVRTFPYLNDWNAKYKDKGLLIVGIHTPEFAFEKKKENVEMAMKELGITFPVVMDNNYGTWNAYQNEYWPRKFIIDLNGNIVYDHIGEGNYDETEKTIQDLLRTIPGNEAIAFETTSTTTNQPSFGISPESYVGYGRMEYNAQTIEDNCHNVFCTYKEETIIPKNSFAFGGSWNIGEESSLGDTGATLTYNAVAKKVHLVLGPESDFSSGDIDIYVDGTLTQSLTISRSDLYTLYEGKSVGNHTVTIRVKRGKVRAYAYTFG